MIPTSEDQINAVYTERAACISLIARMAIQLGWKAGVSQHPLDEEYPEHYRKLVFVDLPTGQLSWHIADHDAELIKDLPVYIGTWDGHSTEQKDERMAKFVPVRPKVY
jgi:hypothetical protein